MPDSTAPQGPRLLAGQTVIFLGDHTSPDAPSYVRVMSDVIGKFHPTLRPNLISAGGKGQTAAAIASRALLDIVLSSRPDWLVIGIGLTDAVREPALRDMLFKYRQQIEERDPDLDLAIGPEYRLDRSDLGPASDIGPEPEPELERLSLFTGYLTGAIGELLNASVRPVLLTTVLIGDDLRNPINLVLRRYNKSIRGIGAEQGVPVVDIERAFRNVLERATNYKQHVSLASPQGDINPQGEALIARTVLHGFGLLPYPGFRPTG